jgi:hypothetical protein
MGSAESYAFSPAAAASRLFHWLQEPLPYDFDALIATIAPRPVLVVKPTMDRATTPADVRRTVIRAREVYDLYSASDTLTLHEPVDYTRLTAATQDAAV